MKSRTKLNYNLSFQWFVGIGMDEWVWNPAVFSKNRQRLLNEERTEVFSQHVQPSPICRMSISRWMAR